MIGILAMQGAVQPHRAKFSKLGIETLAVRYEAELSHCQGLVLPGGESSTVLKLLHDYGLWEPLIEFSDSKPVWGVCAGAILMADRVANPSQEALGLLPVSVERNAYGRQNESFITSVPLSIPGKTSELSEAVFIRAPKITEWDQSLTVLATYEGLPVALQDGRHLMTTFHPELSNSTVLHHHFSLLCGHTPAAIQKQASG